MKTPSSQEYRAAFIALGGRITDNQWLMLRHHYHAPDQTITASEMARAFGKNYYRAVIGAYGWLGRLVGDQLGYNPTKVRLGTLVTFEDRSGEIHWIMRPEVAEALALLGRV
jgi:hypothetical protein